MSMRLEIIRKLPNCRVLFTDGETSYAARGNRLLEIGPTTTPKCRGSIGSRAERDLARMRLIRQLFRLGIHHLLRMPNGQLFVVLRKRAYVVDAAGGSRLVFRFARGNKPASKGVCLTPQGEIFIAEYAVNAARRLPMLLHCSRDGGKSFRTVHEFRPGEIAHYHFVQWDCYENCLWMGTGDRDSECRLYKSTDGDHWMLVGGGSQLWRTVGLAFRPEAIYWGTDAGWTAATHPNYVMRFDRGTGAVEKLLEVQGPCHGNATLRDGTVLISTGIERGINEKDRYAHLWASRDGHRWEELIRFKKDLWFRNLQFGVIRFPVGLENSDAPIFTGMGLVGAGEAAFVARIVNQ
jgi:hypothetical protein